MGKILKQERECAERCIELRKQFRLLRTDEALEELRQAENERHRIYYQYATENEKKRVAKWLKEHSKDRIKCEVCNCEVNRLNLSKHNKTNKHTTNLETQGKTDEDKSEKLICECGLFYF